MKLTQGNVAKAIRNANVSGGSDYIEWDDELHGFGLRIRGKSRNWIVQYKIGAKNRRLTLGSTAMLTADEARNGWKDGEGKKHLGAAIILANAKHGADAAIDRAERRAAAGSTFAAAACDFLEAQEKRLKRSSYEAAARYINIHFKPLHGLALTGINRAIVAAQLRAIANDNGPVSADRARANLSKFFNWALGEGLVDINPVLGTNTHSDNEARDRVLSDDELVAVWKAAPDSDYGRIVKLLILTGQRRDEIGSLRWSEIDMDNKTITLGAERTKNSRPHEFPLSDEAMAILETIPQRDDRDLVFGDGKGGFSGWSAAKAALDEAAGINDPWRLHDLRRTAATRMADSGVQPHVVEAVLNHVSGHRAGVAGVYNRASYSAEKRDALDRLANYVRTALAKADGTNVTRITRPAG